MYPWTVFPTNLKIFYDINKMLKIAVIVGIRVNLQSIQLCVKNPDVIINPAKLVGKMYILLLLFAILYNCATEILMQSSTLAKWVDKMYILLLSFAILYNCAIKIQLQLSTLAKWVDKLYIQLLSYNACDSSI